MAIKNWEISTYNEDKKFRELGVFNGDKKELGDFLNFNGDKNIVESPHLMMKKT